MNDIGYYNKQIKKYKFLILLEFAFILPLFIMIAFLLIFSDYEMPCDETSNTKYSSSITDQEKAVYNSSVTPYVGENKKGVDVKSMIDSIIALNNNNVGIAGNFIEIIPVGWGEDYNGMLEGGSEDNSDEYVHYESNLMSALKSKVDMSKRYNISTKEIEGFIVSVIIEEVSESETGNEVDYE